jgi:hypothetical protein
MKRRIEKYLANILIFTSIISAGCKKEKVPVVSTNETIANVTESTATSGGNIKDDGGAAVTERGVCWSISDSPTTTDSKTTDGSGAGSFLSNITGLSGGETYYIRAFATNSVGTGYGLAILFMTPSQCPGPPIARTLPANNIGNFAAVLNGTVYGNYSKTSVAFEYGTTESYGKVDVSLNALVVTGGTYYALQGVAKSLTPGTLYHYRVKAVNSYGTAYGDDMTFTTLSK